MSELINTHDNRAAIRWKLLTGVSTLALAAYISSASMAKAEDATQPQIWIEFGGQLSRIEGGQELLAPPFLTSQPRPDFETVSVLGLERLPRYSVDMDGKISFEPEGTNWVFTAAIRYGRSNGNKHLHQQTTGAAVQITTKGAHPPKTFPERFDDIKVNHDEKHLVADFMVGKDVGLGMLGRGGNSTLNLGVRFAQFATQSHIGVSSNPDARIYLFTHKAKYHTIDPHHSYSASQRAAREFRGVGPSLSWNASARLVGGADDGAITFDWGANAAVLFGRQKTTVSQHTAATYHGYKSHGKGIVAIPANVQLYNRSASHTRSRAVTVPNAGGFAGLSVRYPNAKISIGYKADMFFGAMDGGIDARKSENRAFYGPYASISIGLGD